MAVNLNGTSQYYSAGSAIGAVRPFMYSVWFWPDVSGGTHLICGQRQNGANNRAEIFKSTTDFLRVNANDGTTTGAVSTGNACAIGGLNHALYIEVSGTRRIVTLNGDTANKGVDTTSLGVLTGVNRTSLGVALATTPTLFFDGRLSEWAVWALSATPSTADEDEWAAMLAAGAPPYAIRPQDVVAWWKCDEAVATLKPIIGSLNLAATASPTTDATAHGRLILPPPLIPVRSTAAPANLNLDDGAFSFSAQPINVNAKTFITLEDAAFSWSAQPANVNAKTAIPLEDATFSFSAKDLGLRSVVALGAATFQWSAKAVTLGSETLIDLAAAAFSWTANALGVNAKHNETLGAALFRWTAQPLGDGQAPLGLPFFRAAFRRALRALLDRTIEETPPDDPRP